MDLLLIPGFLVNLTEVKSFSSPSLSKIFALIIFVISRCNIEITSPNSDPTSSSKDQLRFYVHGTSRLSMSSSTSHEGALVQMSISLRCILLISVSIAVRPVTAVCPFLLIHS